MTKSGWPSTFSRRSCFTEKPSFAAKKRSEKRATVVSDNFPNRRRIDDPNDEQRSDDYWRVKNICPNVGEREIFLSAGNDANDELTRAENVAHSVFEPRSDGEQEAENPDDADKNDCQIFDASFRVFVFHRETNGQIAVETYKKNYNFKIKKLYTQLFYGDL